MRDIRERYPVGAKVHVHYGEGNINNATYEVRAHVDDLVVMRTWTGSERDWAYVMERSHWFKLRERDGCITAEVPDDH